MGIFRARIQHNSVMKHRKPTPLQMQKFMRLVNAQDVAGVEAALQRNPRLAESRNRSGETPLHRAFAFRNEKLIVALDRAGADLDSIAFASGTAVREIAKWVGWPDVYSRLKAMRALTQ